MPIDSVQALWAPKIVHQSLAIVWRHLYHYDKTVLQWFFFVGWATLRCLSATPHPIWGQWGSILIVHYSMIVLKPAIFIIMAVVRYNHIPIYSLPCRFRIGFAVLDPGRRRWCNVTWKTIVHVHTTQIDRKMMHTCSLTVTYLSLINYNLLIL